MKAISNDPNVSCPTEKGFSLIEVAIAVAIIGLLLTPFIIEYNNSEKMRQINLTRNNVTLVDSALRKYAVSYGRYPMPANPSIPNGTRATVGGIEYGSGDEEPNETSTPAAPAYPDCPTDPALSLTSVCRGSGTRDTTADADSSAANDYVYVGTVPYATLGLNESDSVDGFGNKISYTVSAYLTRPAPALFDDEYGTIRVTDTDVNNPADSAGDGRAHFMVLSHGREGVGAYNRLGQQNTPCGDTTARRDNNNCNNDGWFDDGSVTYTYIDPDDGSTRVSRIVTRLNNSTTAAWDNYYSYTDSASSGLWIPIASGTSRDIRGKDLDAVRINTTAQDDRIRVDVNGNVKADSVYTNNLCETTADNDTCMETINIGRDSTPPLRSDPDTSAEGLRCGAYAAMTGISSGDELCDPLSTTDLGTYSNTACAPGTYPVGITAAGIVTCAAP